MAFELPALPSFQTNIQQPDLTQKALEGAQLRNMLSEMALRKALAPGQVQQQQLQLQQQQTATTLGQMQLDSTKKMMEFIASGGLDKFVGRNSGAPEGSGFDATGASTEMARQGIMPEVAQPMIQHFQNIDKTTSEIAKNYGAAAGDFLSNRAKAHSQLAGSLDDAVRSKNPAGVIPSIVARYLKDPQGLSPDEINGLKSLQGLRGDALVKTAGLMSSALNLGAEMDRHHAETATKAAEAATAQQKVINPLTGMSPEQQSEGNKEIAVAQATQPLKIETAKAEAAARFAMEGMAKPVYAYDPKTNSTQLMDQTSALRAGLQPRPVTTKEIQDDTMLTNRLTDVHQKIARFEAAMQQPLSTYDQGRMASLLSSDKLKIGAFGTELPTGRFNEFLDAENVKGLSPAARDQIISYYNARESLVGYNRVLSGSGRSNEQQLQLQMQTLPSPGITDKDFSDRAIGQFKENLRIVGQGLPKIPGVKTPEEWEAANPPSQGMTQMKAPNGTIKSIPDDQVQHYLGLGATVVPPKR